MVQLPSVVSGVFLLLLSFAPTEEVFTDCSVDLHHCVFEDNILAVINDLPSLEECRMECQAEKACQFITYYDPDYAITDPFAGSCILFSQCSLTSSNKGDNICQGCVTLNTTCRPPVKPCSAPVQGGDLLLRSNIDIKKHIIDLCIVHCALRILHYRPQRQTVRKAYYKIPFITLRRINVGSEGEDSFTR